MTTPAGWYDDPERPGTLRYWDGTQWAAQSPEAPPAPPVSPVPPAAAPRRSNTRTWVILGVTIGVILLLILGSCVAIVRNVVNEASEALDPARNSQTGLADGSYSMRPNIALQVNDRCSFTGTAYDADGNAASPSEVTVVGAGPTECGPDSTGSSTATLVKFTVTGGVAKITSATQPSALTS